MLMLSLSTSGPVASAALIEDGTLAGLKFGPEGLTHSETILPLCLELLGSKGLSISDMDAFSADTGPGSFTGVRIGVCAANAMAAAANKPVVGASSLEGLLYGLDHACAIIDCRNGNGYAMARCAGYALPESPVVIAELLQKLPKDALITGDVSLHHDLILSMLPNATLEPAHTDAGRTGLAAWPRLGTASGQLSPLYLRPSQAERMSKVKSHD